MLTRGKESDTYLATVSRQIMMKIDKISSAEEATVLAESYNNLSIFIMICLLTVAR